MPSRTRKPKKPPKTKLLQPLAEGADKDLNPHVFYGILFMLLGFRWWAGSGVALFWNADRPEVSGAFHAAWQILEGQWLGPFSAGTLFTEPLLALVFAGLAALDLSIQSGLSLLVMTGGLYFAFALRRAGAHRWTALVGVALAVFHPASLSSNWQELGPETFWALSGWFAFSALLSSLAEMKSGKNPGLHALAFAIFGAAFLHWGNRSGIWAATLVALIFGLTWGLPWTNWTLKRRLPAALMLLLIPVVMTASFRVATRQMNLRHYGVRLVSQTREGEFLALERTLERVTASEKEMAKALPKWNWLLESKKLKTSTATTDSRHEGVAQKWAWTGYSHGAFRTAGEAELFYRRIRQDIERACETGLGCEPRTSSVVSSLRGLARVVKNRTFKRPDPKAISREVAQLNWVPTHWAPSRGPLSESPVIDRAPAPLNEHQKAAALRAFAIQRLGRGLNVFLGLTLFFVGFRALRRAVRKKFGEWSFLESTYVAVGVFGGIETLVWLMTAGGVHREVHSWLLAAVGSVVLAEYFLITVRRRLDKLERDSRFSIDNPNYLRPAPRTQRRAR